MTFREVKFLKFDNLMKIILKIFNQILFKKYELNKSSLYNT